MEKQLFALNEKHYGPSYIFEEFAGIFAKLEENKVGLGQVL